MRPQTAVFVLAAAICVVIAVPLSGQDRPLEFLANGEAGRDNEAELAAIKKMAGPIPRTPDGKPDFRGEWEPRGGGFTNVLEAHPSGFGLAAAPLSVVIDPPDGKIPYHPWALAERDRHRLDVTAHEDNRGKCMVTGMPRPMWFTIKIVQTPDVFVRLGDERTNTVITHLKALPPLNDRIRLWQGHSVGRWEGDTLVVENSNFNGKFWLALGGDFISEDARIVERFRLVNANRLWYEATITDPKVFTRPWTIRFPGLHTRAEQGAAEVPGVDFDDEDSCHEGNVDIKHLKDAYDKLHGVDAWEKSLIEKAKRQNLPTAYRSPGN